MADINVSGESTIKENYFTTFETKRNTGELGKEDFLYLLVTQLKYQDPLNPMDDKEFIAQMAQFSSLEQMQNLNTSMLNVKAFNMIGKEIYANYENKEINGIVDSVKISNGKVYVVVDDKDISIDDVTKVLDAPTYQQAREITDYTGVINKNITAAFIDIQTLQYMNITGDVNSLTYINGSVYAVLDNVELKIDDVYLEQSEQEGYKDMKTYMEQKQEAGEEVTVVVKKKDETTGNYSSIRVRGKVESFEVDENNHVVSVVLDGVKVPAANIHTIR